MKLKTFALMPAVLALSLALAPAAFAGADKNGGGKTDKPGAGSGHNKNGGGGHNKNGGGGGGGGTVTVGGGNSSADREVLCRLDNRVVYTRSLHECRELEFQLGYRGQRYVPRKLQHGYAHGHTAGHVSGGVVAGGGYGYYQPQRVVRYVAMPSPAARKQAEKRARKAARLAAEAGAYGYAQGGVVGYGNGVVVGGYGNTVSVHGNVYGGGYGYGNVVVKKKRKGKKLRRAVYQQPVYVYGDDGAVVTKGGGY